MTTYTNEFDFQGGSASIASFGSQNPAVMDYLNTSFKVEALGSDLQASLGSVLQNANLQDVRMQSIGTQVQSDGLGVIQ